MKLLKYTILLASTFISMTSQAAPHIDIPKNAPVTSKNLHLEDDVKAARGAVGRGGRAHSSAQPSQSASGGRAHASAQPSKSVSRAGNVGGKSKGGGGRSHGHSQGTSQSGYSRHSRGQHTNRSAHADSRASHHDRQGFGRDGHGQRGWRDGQGFGRDGHGQRGWRDGQGYGRDGYGRGWRDGQGYGRDGYGRGWRYGQGHYRRGLYGANWWSGRYSWWQPNFIWPVSVPAYYGFFDQVVTVIPDLGVDQTVTDQLMAEVNALRAQLAAVSDTGEINQDLREQIAELINRLMQYNPNLDVSSLFGTQAMEGEGEGEMMPQGPQNY